VEEMALAGEVHGYTSGFCCGDYFFVANRTTWLSNGLDSCVQQNLKPIGKWEESIAGGNRTGGTAGRAIHRKFAGVN
jgi:hypothetical protein